MTSRVRVRKMRGHFQGLWAAYRGGGRPFAIAPSLDRLCDRLAYAEECRAKKKEKRTMPGKNPNMPDAGEVNPISGSALPKVPVAENGGPDGYATDGRLGGEKHSGGMIPAGAKAPRIVTDD